MILGPQYHRSETWPTRNVVIPLYEGVTLLDVAGPAEALHHAGVELDSACYRLYYLCCGENDWVTSSTGLPIKGVRLVDLPTDIHLLLVPGAPEAALITAVTARPLMATLRRLAAKATRIASVCTGAFLLGELGLLDGRRVTTHWAGLAALTQRYPAARVAQDHLFEQDGNVWTSAGVLSGVDMTLALIEQDTNRALAMAIAQRLVVFLVRHGGQSQFSAPISLQGEARTDRLAQLVAILQERLAKPWDIGAMAAAVSMSERTLHRRCKEAFELTPAQLLAELRLEHARTLLLSAQRSIKAVALASGYGTPSSLTKAFTERFGVAPTRYRENFA